MQAAIDAVNSLSISIYFLSFIIIFHLLFADVFISIVCESFLVRSQHSFSLSVTRQGYAMFRLVAFCRNCMEDMVVNIVEDMVVNMVEDMVEGTSPLTTLYNHMEHQRTVA